MVFVHSVILIGLWANFLRKYTPNLMFAFILCFVFEGFVISFNLLRNSIALGLFVNAIPFIAQRKPFHYYALCLVAVSFHYSSLFFLPLYFFLHLRIPKYIFLGFFLGCSAIYILNIPIFESIVDHIVGDNEAAGKVVKAYTGLSHEVRLSPIFFERLMTGLLVFCYYDKIIRIQKDAPVFINSFLLYISCVFLFSDLSEVSSRLSMLFVFSYWILYCTLFRCFNLRNNKLLFLGFLSLYSTYRTIMPMRSEIYKYENIMFGARSFNERAAMFDKLNGKED